MNQTSFQALTAMLNAFPQSAANTQALLLTYDKALTGIADQAITDAAGNFISGAVSGQSLTFAPSVAEFCAEARRTPVSAYRALPGPKWEPYREPGQAEKVRMGFKMSLLSAAWGNGRIEALAAANRHGLEDLVALGQLWGVPVPDELFEQIKSAA